MKINLDLEKCIGCGSCESLCPDIFEIGDDNKAHIKDSKRQGNQKKKELKEEGCSRQAADICPVQAIKIEN